MKPCHKTGKTCKNIARECLIVKGINTSGEIMRPSSQNRWNEMLCGMLAHIPYDKRILYAHCLQPVVENGILSIRIGAGLRSCDPDIYYQVIDFALDNNLQVKIDEEEKP